MVKFRHCVMCVALRKGFFHVILSNSLLLSRWCREPQESIKLRFWNWFFFASFNILLLDVEIWLHGVPAHMSGCCCSLLVFQSTPTVSFTVHCYNLTSDGYCDGCAPTLFSVELETLQYRGKMFVQFCRAAWTEAWSSENGVRCMLGHNDLHRWLVFIWLNTVILLSSHARV